MLKILRKEDGEILFTVSGRLTTDSVSELSALLAAEPSDRTLALDLTDLVLVDRETVRFLRVWEADGIVLRNCPSFIRVWIASDEAYAD